MARIESRLKEIGLTLPAPLVLPDGMTLPFPWVNVRGDRAYVSGHGPQEADGSSARPLGPVGGAVTLDEGYETALSMLASLKRELGDLDRITGWCRVHGMILCAPGFNRTPAVMNGFSDLILDVFGPDVGSHARTAVGVAALPGDIPVEIEAELLIRDWRLPSPALHAGD